VHHWKETRKDAREFSLVSTYNTLSSALFNARAKGGKNEKGYQKIERPFWQGLSILPKINQLDSRGKIDNKDNLDPEAEEAQSDTEHAQSEDELDEEGMGDDGVKLDRMIPSHRSFQNIFRKAHMQIASTLSQGLQDDDTGAGVGNMADEDENNAIDGNDRLDDEMNGSSEMIGIIELKLPASTVQFIQKRLQAELANSDTPTEEIWLDALVTVLEESGGLKSLQKYFLKPAMIQPKRPQEWGRFNDEKDKMEKRLDYFLKWLQAETKFKYYEYLQRCAEKKERVLRLQSCVQKSYLDQLEEQITNIKVEIRDLEHKNAEMRAHVSPLL